MAMDVRKTGNDIAFSLVAAHNQRMIDAIGSSFHGDRTSTTDRSDYKNPSVTRVTVTAANGTDLPTALTLVNNIKSVVDTHFADTIAHDTATSAAITIADGTDQATAITLANDLKAKYNTHLSESNVHFNNDGTNDVTNANATDLATLNTLINEIKGDVNAHMASAPSGTYINLIDA